jgi:hypothetical protein
MTWDVRARVSFATAEEGLGRCASEVYRYFSACAMAPQTWLTMLTPEEYEPCSPV